MTRQEVNEAIRNRHIDALRYGIETELDICTGNEWIVFETAEQRENFISELIDDILCKEEIYDHDPCGYTPNFKDLVSDYADELGIWATENC